MAIVKVYNRDGSEYGELNTNDYVFNNEMITFEPTKFSIVLYPYIKINGVYYVNDGGDFYSTGKSNNSAVMMRSTSTYLYKNSPYFDDTEGFMSNEVKTPNSFSDRVSLGAVSQSWYKTKEILWPWETYYIPGYGIDGAAINGNGLIVGYNKEEDGYKYKNVLKYDDYFSALPQKYCYVSKTLNKFYWLYEDFNYSYTDSNKCRLGGRVVKLKYSSGTLVAQVIGDTTLNYQSIKFNPKEDICWLFFRKPVDSLSKSLKIFYDCSNTTFGYEKAIVDIVVDYSDAFEFKLNDIEIRQLDFNTISDISFDHNCYYLNNKVSSPYQLENLPDINTTKNISTTNWTKVAKSLITTDDSFNITPTSSYGTNALKSYTFNHDKNNSDAAVKWNQKTIKLNTRLTNVQYIKSHKNGIGSRPPVDGIFNEQLAFEQDFSGSRTDLGLLGASASATSKLRLVMGAKEKANGFINYGLYKANITHNLPTSIGNINAIQYTEYTNDPNYITNFYWSGTYKELGSDYHIGNATVTVKANMAIDYHSGSSDPSPYAIGVLVMVKDESPWSDMSVEVTSSVDNIDLMVKLVNNTLSEVEIYANSDLAYTLQPLETYIYTITNANIVVSYYPEANINFTDPITGEKRVYYLKDLM